VNDRIAVLETIHARLADHSVDGMDVVVDPTWIGVLMSMTPDPEITRRGSRWVESRSERLHAGRAVYAVISRDGGELRVTAYMDAWKMAADKHRIAETILGRPRGVRIRSMNALDLLHRTVVNEHGAAFHVGGLYLDAGSGRIEVDLLDLDEDDNPIPGSGCGIFTLDGWEVN
jgi:hypothetical protein